MTNRIDNSQLAEEAELRRLPLLYARAMDRSEPEILDSIFTVDAELVSPGYTAKGRAEIRATPAMLRDMFASTLHTVLNQTVAIDGDVAKGETYSIAYHLKRPEAGEAKRIDWAIRYQDRFVKEHQRWRFARRELIVDWAETSNVDLPKS